MELVEVSLGESQPLRCDQCQRVLGIHTVVTRGMYYFFCNEGCGGKFFTERISEQFDS